MKKRKFKQFFKENWGNIATIIWIILIPTSIIYAMQGGSVWIMLVLIAISAIYTIIGLVVVCKLAEKEEKEKEKNKNKRLQELKIQDKYYIELVNRQVEEILKKFKSEEFEIIVDKTFNYLISFSNNIDWTCKNRIVGKPDSFIIASCLLYSLINYPIITIKSNNDEQLKIIESRINLIMAMNCALEIISEPITYIKNNEIWVEEKHPKVNLIIPKGLIKDNELHKRILNTIYRDELANNRTSIMQLSNLFHLIYLNCQ